MNIDELQAGRELDALIATRIFNQSPPDGFAQSGHEWRRVHQVSIDTYFVVESWPERYSTDIAAAWKVVEQIEKTIYLYRIKSGRWKFRIGSYLATVEADTAPLAICRAALKAVLS